MIYMVEMAFGHKAHEAEWNAWYLAHIGVLLTVPGFRASQRFEAIVANPSPYLALHEVESAALFDSSAYRSRGGPSSVGHWRELQSNWHRNLLEGLDETPEVPQDKTLVMLRDAAALPPLPGGAAVDWLNGVGLDRSVRRCGLAIVADPLPLIGLAERDDRIRLFRPISAKIRA
ncbi:MAG TPA: hypothetical protein VFW46_12770 [Stellaceae bacterium]|jgi:hypothetical protein|nr:hypothetical protein [Stellaceae bacterium]